MQKIKKKLHTSHTHTATAWLMFRFVTEDTVVTGVGVADDSRTEYDVSV